MFRWSSSFVGKYEAFICDLFLTWFYGGWIFVLHLFLSLTLRFVGEEVCFVFYFKSQFSKETICLIILTRHLPWRWDCRCIHVSACVRLKTILTDDLDNMRQLRLFFRFLSCALLTPGGPVADYAVGRTAGTLADSWLPHGYQIPVPPPPPPPTPGHLVQCKLHSVYHMYIYYTILE